MKIVALAGSPRRRGNTGLLLEAALQGVRDRGWEAELFDLNSLSIKPCQGCNSCQKRGTCIYEDDMQRLYEAFDRAGAFIISSPVYFTSVSAQLKVVIDRCQAYYWSTYGNFGLPPVARKKRPGVFLASSGRPLEKGGSFEHSLAVIETWGLALGMKIVQKVLVPDTDRMPVTEASIFLEQAYQAGSYLADWLR